MKLPSSNIENKSLQFLFSGREFPTIPHFQRDYSWTHKEIDELFDDIKEEFNIAKSSNSIDDGYLLGNIIFLTFNRKELFVIDGQQRLTTFFIIFEEIKKYINPQYTGLINIVNDFLYIVDSYGNSNNIMKLQRKDNKGNYSPINIDAEIKNYIINKTKELFTYKGFDEDNEIFDFILNTNFIVQRYIDITEDSESQKNIFTNIMKYFIKFNTRGKPFNKKEETDLLNKI